MLRKLEILRDWILFKPDLRCLEATQAEMGWRRRRDSNPRNVCTLNGFQDRRIQPLCHSSVAGRLFPTWQEEKQ